MSLSLIAAVSKNNCIGKDSTLPWHIPQDLKHFKKLTINKPVLMGRKTWESLPEQFRPLPQRTNIVITRQGDYTVPQGVKVYPSVENAIATHQDKELIIIGGAEMYRQSIDKADTLYITHVHQSVDGEAFFPEIDMHMWKEVEREDHTTFSFVTYKRETI